VIILLSFKGRRRKRLPKLLCRIFAGRIRKGNVIRTAADADVKRITNMNVK
jgi:hypothetical protein